MKLITIAAFLWISFTVGAQNKLTRREYIDHYNDLAIKEMKRTGIPASITLAQGILESNNGNSTLAINANNHFGIKCHKDWNGKTYTHDDDRPNECFRKYRTPYDSYMDHSEFLTRHQRYAFLFEYETTDYKNWAKGLKKAGYATHPKYDKLLIQIIEDNELYKFDDKKYKPVKLLAEKEQKYLPIDIDDYAINPFGNDIQTYNRIDFVVAKTGDTFESLAEKYEMMPWQIKKYNELDNGRRIKPGMRIYLQPKRRKADIIYKQHIVQEGEDMYSISQEYGIKLKYLYRKNNMEPGSQPEIGQELSLRKKVKSKNI
jgi:LysM repeat protein